MPHSFPIISCFGKATPESVENCDSLAYNNFALADTFGFSSNQLGIKEPDHNFLGTTYFMVSNPLIFGQQEIHFGLI